jgi:hypothetical protein
MKPVNKVKYSFILIGIAFQSCNKPPELPIIPAIEFESVEFVQADGPDSLIVSVHFTDGDGDLGLTSDDIYPPYQAYDVVLDENNDTIKYGSAPGLPEYNPIDYIILRDANGSPTDTILVKINENHYNFFVRFFQKKYGKYTEFDWRDKPFYQTFDGRFPLLNNSDKSRPLEGSLRYGMVSSGWLFLFRDTMKVQIQIQDRALNKSNLTESEDFTLEGVKRK